MNKEEMNEIKKEAKEFIIKNRALIMYGVGVVLGFALGRKSKKSKTKKVYEIYVIE